MARNRIEIGFEPFELGSYARDSMETPRIAVTFKQRIPWGAKLAAKIVLSRLPISYKVWKSLGAFELGDMNRPEYAIDVFKKHWHRVHLDTEKQDGFVALELGPGDSLFSALIAKAFGSSKTYLVDVGSFATADVESYRRMARLLESSGFSLPECAKADSLDEMLRASSGTYLTRGLLSVREIPSASVDFIWSQHVLEHIRRDDFLPLFRELKRIQKPLGVSSHSVDLKDHLGGSLNNLRFPDSLWESNFMSKSGFYTNRIRCTEMLCLFSKAGYQPEVLNVDRWTELPTPRARLAEPFSTLPFEELSVSGFDVVLH